MGIYRSVLNLFVQKPIETRRIQVLFVLVCLANEEALPLHKYSVHTWVTLCEFRCIHLVVLFVDDPTCYLTSEKLVFSIQI